MAGQKRRNTMRNMKKLGWVLVLAGVVLVLMVLKTLKDHRWPGDTGEAARALALRTAYVQPSDFSSLGGETGILKLEAPAPDSLTASCPVQEVTLATLADRAFAGTLASGERKWVIVAGDPATAVTGWVVLHQQGVRGVFILEGSGGEPLKYQFRPDTTIRPEPVTHDGNQEGDSGDD